VKRENPFPHGFDKLNPADFDKLNPSCTFAHLHIFPLPSLPSFSSILPEYQVFLEKFETCPNLSPFFITGLPIWNWM